MTMNVTRAPSRPSLKLSLDAGSHRIVGYHDGGAASATEPSDSSEPSDMAAIIRTRTRVTVPQERSAENTYPRIATEQPAPECGARHARLRVRLRHSRRSGCSRQYVGTTTFQQAFRTRDDDSVITFPLATLTIEMSGLGCCMDQAHHDPRAECYGGSKET